MCIIVAKPMGVSMPEEKVLKNCFESNPDGAGFMVANGKAVRIRKGFMDFDAFMDAIGEQGDLTEFGVVMHFRIATHGEVKPSCCHPFPVSDDKSRLTATECVDRIGVAHNGVIDAMKGKTSKDVSDTMAYVAEVVAPMRRLHEDFMNNDNALDVLEATVGSKLCFLDNSGDIVTIGDFVEDDGVYYSNTSYLSWFSSYKSYSSVWSSYDDYYSKYRTSEGDWDWDEIEDAVTKLPWAACADCAMQCDCAMDFPYCDTERIAELEAASMS